MGNFAGCTFAQWAGCRPFSSGTLSVSMGVTRGIAYTPLLLPPALSILPMDFNKG